MHDADQDGTIGDSLFHVVGTHQAVPVYRQIGDAKALLFQVLAGVQDRMVLDLGGNDVIRRGVVAL